MKMNGNKIYITSTPSLPTAPPPPGTHLGADWLTYKYKPTGLHTATYKPTGFTYFHIQAQSVCYIH